MKVFALLALALTQYVRIVNFLGLLFVCGEVGCPRAFCQSELQLLKMIIVSMSRAAKLVSLVPHVLNVFQLSLTPSL